MQLHDIDNCSPSHTRAQAVADGDLVDVTERALEMGIPAQVFLTRRAFETCVRAPEGSLASDEQHRLCQILNMLRIGMLQNYGAEHLRVIICAPNNAHPRMLVELLVSGANRDVNDLAPSVTVMMPDEEPEQPPP